MKKFSPNEVLQGRYKIIENFNEGGMGCVDIAWDIQRSQYVVIKYAKNVSNEKTNEICNRKMRVEIDILRECDHPHIVRYVDSFIHEGMPVLVMGYINGVTLEDLCASGALPEVQIIKITQDILLGISHLSQKGIIYRDLKPSNVLINKENHHAVIIDFGTAKKGKLEAQSITGPGASTQIYTACFAPREQIMGLKVDFRTDIFAVGMTMYFMLKNENPPNIGERPNPLITDQSGKYSKRIVDVINRSTKENPDERYQTAVEMFNALSGGSIHQSFTQYVSVPRVSPGTPRIILKQLAGIAVEQIFPLNKNITLIGREEPGFNPRPDITVKDTQVSLKGDGKRYGHAQIMRDSVDNCYLEDLASSNKTYVNNREIHTPVLLQNGDIISLGLYTKFEFRKD